MCDSHWRRIQAYLHSWKEHGDEEVAEPVEETGKGHGGWARALLEQLGADELRDRTLNEKHELFRLNCKR